MGTATVACVLRLGLVDTPATRAREALFPLAVPARGLVIATVSNHACLPTSVRLAVVVELLEVRVQAAASASKGVPTLCGLV